MLYLYIILYYYFIYISLEYEININSLDIPSDLVYEGPFENKNELESSCGHSGQSQLDTSYYCKNDNCVLIPEDLQKKIH